MIAIANEQRRVPIPEAEVRRVARRLLMGRSLSIAFVTDAAIRKINRRFLGHDWVTDVISFPLGTDLLGAGPSPDEQISTTAPSTDAFSKA